MDIFNAAYVSRKACWPRKFLGFKTLSNPSKFQKHFEQLSHFAPLFLCFKLNQPSLFVLDRKTCSFLEPLYRLLKQSLLLLKQWVKWIKELRKKPVFSACMPILPKMLAVRDWFFLRMQPFERLHCTADRSRLSDGKKDNFCRLSNSRSFESPPFGVRPFLQLCQA